MAALQELVATEYPLVGELGKAKVVRMAMDLLTKTLQTKRSFPESDVIAVHVGGEDGPGT